MMYLLRPNFASGPTALILKVQALALTAAVTIFYHHRQIRAR